MTKFTFFTFYIFLYGFHVVSVFMNSHFVTFPLYFYSFCTYFEVVHLYVPHYVASVPHAPPHNKYMQKPQISTSLCHCHHRQQRRRWRRRINRAPMCGFSGRMLSRYVDHVCTSNNITTRHHNNTTTPQYNNTTTQQCDNTTIKQYNNTTKQQYDNTTIQQYNNATI